jgi:hypothetical protein
MKWIGGEGSAERASPNSSRIFSTFIANGSEGATFAECISVACSGLLMSMLPPSLETTIWPVFPSGPGRRTTTMLLLFLAAHDTRKKRRETLIKSVLALFMEMPLYRRITSKRWDL